MSCWCRAWPGPGRSTLLAHLAWWWQRTGLVDQVFRFSYEDRAWTAGQIIREIRSGLLSPAEHARADTMSEAAQAEQVAALLRADRHLLILDNAESITAAPAAIPHALSPGERGSSRRSCPGCAAAGPWCCWAPARHEDLAHGAGPRYLPAARPRPAGRLAAGRPDPFTAMAPPLAATTPNAPRCRTWSTLLGGYPLPLTVVLPVLATTPPSQVLAELEAGGPGADPAGLIRRAIEYSHGKLDPALQNSLLLLAPSPPSSPPAPFLDSLPGTALPGRGRPGVWGRLTSPRRSTRPSASGLAAPHPQLGYLVQVQPVLPWFLRSRLHDQPALPPPPAKPTTSSTCNLAAVCTACSSHRRPAAARHRAWPRPARSTPT